MVVTSSPSTISYLHLLHASFWFNIPPGDATETLAPLSLLAMADFVLQGLGFVVTPSSGGLNTETARVLF